MELSDIIIILSRPSEPGNVGAVCRAMKNMGLSRLRIAGTAKSALNQEEILARAVHAGDIWEETRFFASLAEAAADCALLVGTTRRRGRRRKHVSMDCRELADWLRNKPGKTALAFGNERTGLEDGELDICNIASHIPVSGDFPSLNLSHAVQIYAYELFSALHDASAEAVKGAWIPVSREAADALTASVSKTLEGLGFYKHPGRKLQEQFFRDILSRAGLTEGEGNYLADIVKKTARLAFTHAG
jgi:tRNA/rRNA methyltransferase/tRNA (cytidine32/uridine32-2'-O)-methyltransferase